ncbi:RHS repeat-associated core domain-containing protein [Rhodoferax antarcticus]|uniref:RHS repeat-associated core domain-containing protein n=1 Tax=Rhodoferax antarcticus TaxID=81479 RepID=UPI001A7E0B3B|nr:RHS repeat-associated core domain-containing protein [Rhodoferax antarcticus]
MKTTPLGLRFWANFKMIGKAESAMRGIHRELAKTRLFRGLFFCFWMALWQSSFASPLIGTAAIKVPRKDVWGVYDQYYGFQNFTDAIESVHASLSANSYPCGTNGAVPIGYFTSTYSIALGQLTIYVSCRALNGSVGNGLYGSVAETCPKSSGYVNSKSSMGLLVCADLAGINMAKSAGQTEGPGCKVSTSSTCNPINIGTGNKWLREQDYVGFGSYPLQFSRFYNSGVLINTILGSQWSTHYSRKLMVSTNASYPIVGVFREDGKVYTYSLTNGVWVSDADIKDKLTQSPGGGWNLITNTNEVESYDATGKLLSIRNAAGLAHTMDYDSAGRIWHVTDQAGRKLTFTYDSNNRIYVLTVPNGGQYQYDYDIFGNLIRVTYPDARTKQYLYNEAGYSITTVGFATYPNVLTGIIDESGSRYASYWYADGKAYKEEHAPGLNLGIDRNTLSFGSDASGNPRTIVTDALNTARTYSYKTILGIPRSTGQTQPAGSGSAAASSAQTYDASGNVTSRKDFVGNTTCYSYDLTRNLETVRVEGLAPGKACPSNLAAYQPIIIGNSVERKITTQWHASYRLPTLIAEPLRVTTLFYDPGTGNLLTQTLQPTTDATGGAGSAATYTGIARTTTNTYFSTSDARNGQLHTVDGPRTDVTDITSFDYDTTTGDLISITNALNQTTTLSSYDADGRPEHVTDPNGLSTFLTYAVRGRLTSIDSGGEITTYTYDAIGNLIGVVRPDGSQFTYAYDAAHRLTQITDSLGNHINYTLDAIGNRTQEKVFDSAGTQVVGHSRTFDALSRLYQDIGAVNQTTVFSYDANGNLATVKDPLNRQSTSAYDALNRLLSSKDPANGITALGYDNRDQLVKVTDPRNLITQYTTDGLGNESQLTSPDTGITGRTLDAAGNVLTMTDAKGQLRTYTFDALNRVLTATYSKAPTTPITISYTYDQGVNGIGHLTGITEPTGTTAYGYDQHGRLTSGTRTAHGMQYTTIYSYDSQGRLASIGYPSGRLVSYTFDAMGRVSGVSSTVNNVTKALASNITYAPFGGVSGFSFGDGTTAPVQSYARTFDQDGRLATYTLKGVLNTVGFDAASQITIITNAQSPTLPALYGYDNLSRLTNYAQNTTGYNYSYDADGNRTSLTIGASTTTYTYPATSNRLSGVVRGATAPVTTDANGSVINDFDRQYAYDLRGKLIQTTTTLGNVNYEVDAKGLRVRKQAAYSGGSDTMFFYDGQGHLIGEVPTGGATFSKEYVYLGDLPLAVTDAAGGFNYVHTDHLGTPRVITNAAAQAVWRWDNSDPYGDNVPNENPSGLGVYHFDIGFPGQYSDRETGIVYNINRNLNKATGRYNESDLIGLDGGVNTYGYADGSPVTKTDPFGLATYICKRPLGGSPGSYAPPLLNHTYVCIGSGANITCGSTTASSGGAMSNIFGSSKGKPTTSVTDYYKREACEERQSDDRCIETCIANELENPTRPKYGVGPSGTDCQEYTEDVVRTCEKRCVRR